MTRAGSPDKDRPADITGLPSQSPPLIRSPTGLYLNNALIPRLIKKRSKSPL